MPASRGPDWELRETAPELRDFYLREGHWTDDTLTSHVVHGLAANPDLEFRVWSHTRPTRHTIRDLNKLARGEKAPVVVNLASQEYFRAADRAVLKPRVVDCQFEDWKNGEYKIISFFAKRARGLMARYAIQNRLETPEGLKGFDLDGYRLAPEASSPDRLVFRRKP